MTGDDDFLLQRLEKRGQASATTPCGLLFFFVERKPALCVFWAKFATKKIMGSLVVTPKSAEELKFLVDLLERLGISAHMLSEEEESVFLSEHELAEIGKDFLEQRARAALQQKNLKTWKEVQTEAAAKYNWPTS